MISSDFAHNETGADAFTSLGILLQPWRWYKGKELDNIKKILERKFFPDHGIHLYLSARAGLYYLLQTLNFHKGSEVLVQAFTCEAVILPILENKLQPIYVDIEPESYSMDIKDLRKKLSSKSKTIILQHSFGITPKFREEIIALAKSNKLTIIEDMAHGSDFQQLRNDKNRTIKLLSFGRSKAFSSVFGGCLAIRDYHLNQKVKKQSAILFQPSFLFILRCLLYKILTVPIKSTYRFLFIGKILHKMTVNLHIFISEVSSREKKGKFDYILARAYPNALACLLSPQLKRYYQTAKVRKKNVEYYARNLQYDTDYEIIERYSLIRFPLLVEDRDTFIKKLQRYDIYLGKWYDQVVAPKEVSLKKMNYIDDSCPVAEKISKQIINIPTNLNDKKYKKVVDILNRVLIE